MQRAFLPYDGTFEDLNVVNAIIHDARRNRKDLRMASLDLRKAFDMVSHDAIKYALAARGYSRLFTEYVSNVYAGSRTIIKFVSSTKSIRPTRGVRQGDPLSPLLFNLVLDDVFRSLEKEDIGYTIGEKRALGVAYADDVILTAHSKASLQRILDIAVLMLSARGLTVNVDKSFSMSLVRAGKVKKVKVADSPEFMIGDEALPCMVVGAKWKYLGLFLDDRGRLPTKCDELSELTDRISAAPLKPAQRLVILKDFLVPRFIHRLLCGPIPTAKYLNELDQLFRNVVKRRWLHLESSVPSGFLYVKVSHGGLGIPCLLTRIPRLRRARLVRLQWSSYDTVKWVCSTEEYATDLAKTEALCKSTRHVIEKPQHEIDYWASRLYKSFDGTHMGMAAKLPYVHRWVHGMPYLSGREFIHLVKFRINALPTRARLARGRPAYDRKCRHGCDQVETLNHITQVCSATHRATIKRHDDICKQIVKVLTKKGHVVQREKFFREPHCPGLKPDLIVITRNLVHVLDIEICGTSRDLHLARRDKIEKYNVAWLSRRLPESGRPRKYGSITVTSTGVWHPDSADDLLQLGFTKAKLVDLTVHVVQGSLRVFRIHRDHKG